MNSRRDVRLAAFAFACEFFPFATPLLHKKTNAAILARHKH